MDWTANKIRRTFIEFFESRGHKEVPSAPVVIKNDPTLMFTNAGMNQFKDYFLGHSEPENLRVCDAQKCLRVSGKHNDLEEVGTDTYHHTLFEMLGNWSFGDYFKEEAVDWAWELLTREFGISKDRLYVTVFGGDEEDGLGSDREAEKHWLKHVPADRIMHFDKKDNFWEMGASGPCGPASEIHVDIRSDEERAAQDAKELVNRDHPRVIEIWNLVFIEYNRSANGKLEPLPNQHVDTGMGLERLAMVLQGRQSNYDIDLFQTLISAVEKVTDTRYGGTSDKRDVAVRVVADHIRAVAFCIADGQLPSNTGAGYVIRRILRRAVRYGFSFLNTEKPFLYELVSTLTEEMGGAYPELKSQNELITKVIREEEASFLRTLDKGIAKFNAYRKTGKKTVDGKFAFELYDTYGFPVDLTQLLAAENDMEVDKSGFDEALSEQKKRSQDAGKQDLSDWVKLRDEAEGEFVGYDELETEVRILRYREVKKKKASFYQLVLNRTPFYPEGGGQVGDSGVLTNERETIKVTDTRRENNLIVHVTKELPQDPERVFKASVNERKRQSAARNHTATHLLHKALREVLGTHVEQKGSLVHPDYLRFDFSHFQKPGAEELEAVEKYVNEQVLANAALEENRNADPEKAVQEGALALFGEKYGDKVRVIKFGNSVELCGGTHVKSTGAVGLFKFVSESSVASGVRRVEAVTGEKAYERVRNHEETIRKVGELVKNPKNPLSGTERLVKEKTELEQQLESYREKEKQARQKELLNELEEVNGIQFTARTSDMDPGTVKDISFKWKKDVRNTVVVLGSKGKKATVSLFISADLVDKYGLNAGTWIRDLAKHIKGGGGGQPFFATAGGGNASGLENVYAEVRRVVEEL